MAEAYTIAKAAELLGVTRATLYNWIREKKVAITRIGPRTAFVTSAEVERVKKALKARAEAF